MIAIPESSSRTALTAAQLVIEQLTAQAIPGLPLKGRAAEFPLQVYGALIHDGFHHRLTRHLGITPADEPGGPPLLAILRRRYRARKAPLSAGLHMAAGLLAEQMIHGRLDDRSQRLGANYARVSLHHQQSRRATPVPIIITPPRSTTTASSETTTPPHHSKAA